jgi:CubicO group peptidase (beta-lactamase class C family)
VTKHNKPAPNSGNLFGQTIPAGLGGGTLDDTTPVLPLVASNIGLGPNGEVAWQAPASIYSATHPVNLSLGIPCSTTDGLINPNWDNVNIANLLGHTAGFQPNQNWQFSPGTSSCSGAVGEVCGTTGNVGDPTIGSVTRMANDLGLGYGIPSSSDVVRWIAGVCPFDIATANRWRYSNVGFTVAGRVVENLSGQGYEDFVTGYLASDGIIDLDAPGNPIVYLGHNLGGGPIDYLLPPHMEEATYYSLRPDGTDVTTSEFDMDTMQWTFPNTVVAPYGTRNYNVMDSHGGLVMNALALAQFGS